MKELDSLFRVTASGQKKSETGTAEKTEFGTGKVNARCAREGDTIQYSTYYGYCMVIPVVM